MQFSTDERHAAKLDFLAGVRDYIASWPAHPMNRDMIQRIEAHRALSLFFDEVGAAIKVASMAVPTLSIAA